ncbi:MAG: hypothetical protein V3W34_19905, partial [Phycisphaerae bacterium]
MMRSILTRVIGFGILLTATGENVVAQPSSEVCGCKNIVHGNCVSPELCVRWDNSQDPPVAGTDFELTYDYFGKPTVELRIGDNGQGTTYEWRVWCKDSSGAADEINEIKGLSDYDFHVTLLNDTGGAGASSVGIIDLNPLGDNKFSRIADGQVSGDLTTSMFLQQASGGVGGNANMTLGSVSGNVTIPVVAQGDLFKIDGQLSANLTVSDLMDGTLTILGGVTSNNTVTIQQLAGAVILGASGGNALAANATLDLKDGIPSVAGQVIFNGRCDGTIDLNGFDVANNLRLYYGGSGEIRNGGTVSATVLLAEAELPLGGASFSGTATFASVATNAEVVTKYSVGVEGNVTVTSSCDGKIELGTQFWDGGHLGDGTNPAKISVGSLGTTGTIVVWDDVRNNADIKILGDCDNVIDIQGQVLDGATIDIDGALTGEIEHYGDLEGTILIGGAVGQAGLIKLNTGLAATGLVDLSGLLSGRLLIGDGTAYGSLIHLKGGLDSLGAVTINA